VVGTFAFIIALLVVAPTHMSADYVFTQFNHPGGQAGGRAGVQVGRCAWSSSLCVYV